MIFTRIFRTCKLVFTDNEKSFCNFYFLQIRPIMGDKREGWHEKTFVSHVFARIARHQFKISKPELLPLSWNRTAFFLAIHFQKENKPCIWGWFVHWKNYWLIKGIMHSLNTTLLAQYTKDFRKHWINKNPISVIYSIVTKKVYLFFYFCLL